MSLSRTNRRKVASLLLAGCFLTLGGCKKEAESAGLRAPSDRPAAPEFTLRNLKGDSVSLAQLRGKPVFLDFWATWCGPCRMSIPSVQKLHEEFGDRVHVVGINLDDSPAGVPSFVKSMGITYPILLGGTSGVDSLYGVSGIPAFLLLDGEGRAVDGWTGFDPRYGERWRQAVDQLLSGK